MFVKSVAKYLLLVGVTATLFSISAMAEEKQSKGSSSVQNQSEKKKLTKEEILAPEYLKKLSLAYGHAIGKNLDNPVVKLNVQDVIKGIQDASDGKLPPLQESECEEAFRLLQQYAQTEALTHNLAEAEVFLKDNSKLEGIVELEPSKLQYKVLQVGAGELVTEEVRPTINYSATYLNGMALGSSDQHGGPIELSLDETIPGFRRGLVGMKVGEKRRLFVHPDLAYGSSGPLPNGLLIFDIEVVKVAPNPSKGINIDSVSSSDGGYDEGDGDNDQDGDEGDDDNDDDDFDISDLDDDDDDDDYDDDDDDTDEYDIPMMIDTSDDDDSDQDKR